MPGFILHLGATVMCVHSGTATPTAPNPRVSVTGQPVTVLTTPYTIAGCTFPAMTGGNSPPCVTAQFTVGATRVMAGGQPVLVQSSQATCVPNGTPVIISVTQTRVTAQ